MKTNPAALLITNPTNIRYLTGFIGVAPDEREAFVLQTRKQTYLLTNSLYLEQAASLPDVTLVQISREYPISQALADLTDTHAIRKLECEEDNLTVAEFTKLKQALTHVRLVPVKNRIETLRMIKRNDEIAHIRAAAQLTDACFTHLLTVIKPGVTEGAIARAIETFFRDHDAENAFSPIVAFDAHASMPHYNTPRQGVTLSANATVLLDFGARVNGYCADMTRVVCVGIPNKEWRAAYEAVRSANETALTLLRNGERNGATLDAAAREVIAEAGFPVYPHSLGHAVGLAIHEAPRLTVSHAESLLPGMVVTVEPGIYVEGSYGIRIEDLVLLKDDAIDVLSTAPKDCIIL